MRKKMKRQQTFLGTIDSAMPAVARKQTVRGAYKYKPHGSGGVNLNTLQEFFILMIYLRQGLDKTLLADKFLGSTGEPALKRINSILRTEILKVENWWLDPSNIDRAQSTAFSSEIAERILTVADCTNVNCQSSSVLEIIRQQLHSTYYKSTCGKYCVGVSKIGGCTFVSPGQGGPASDHQCMKAAGLFDKSKWAVPEGEDWPQLLYDAAPCSSTGVRPWIKTSPYSSPPRWLRALG